MFFFLFGFYGMTFPGCFLGELLLCIPDRFLTLLSLPSSLTACLDADLGILLFLYTLTRSWQSQSGFQPSFYDVGINLQVLILRIYPLFM